MYLAPDWWASQNVSCVRKKYTLLLYWQYKLFIKRTCDQEKIKQVEKRFFAKTSSWNPFQAYQLELRIIYSSCNTKYDKGKHTACFSICSKRKCSSLSWNKSTKNILLLLSTLYWQNPLIQGINTFATLDYYIPSTVTFQEEPVTNFLLDLRTVQWEQHVIYTKLMWCCFTKDFTNWEWKQSLSPNST